MHSNIVTFQYVLSDLGKYNSREEIKLFFEKFYDRIIRHLPSGALIILNDINHKELSRDIFALLEDVLPEKGYNVEKYHFKNDVEPSRNNYFCYGTEIKENRVPCHIPEYIDNRYNPWIKGKSAALIIRKG